MPNVKEIRRKEIRSETRRAAPPVVTAPDGAVQEMLELIATLVITALPRPTDISFALVCGPRGQAVTTVATKPATRELDSVQQLCGRGPCLEAINTGRDARAVLASGQWPEMAAMAEPLGIKAAWSIPLARSGPPVGALNIYSTNGQPWLEAGAATARVAAALTALELGRAKASADLAHGNETLREALETRTVIGQAQGVLMARENIGAAAAFDILRRASQRTNRKLRDIAVEMVAGVGQHVARSTQS